MKRKFVLFLKNNRRGFSITGVIVAAGMMGGLALFLANLSKQQHVTQKKAETGVEITGLHQKILSVLYDGEACTASLGVDSFIPIAGTNQTRGLNQLKNKAGTVVVEAGKKINRLLEVESITLKNTRGNTGMTREVDMEFVIKKTSKAITGYEKVVKTFPLTVELKTLPNVLARCHHTLDAKEEGIKESMCVGLGGTFTAHSGSVPSSCSTVELFRKDCMDMQGIWDATAKKCSVDNLYKKFCEETGGTYTDAPVMKCDMNDVYAAFCTSLQGTYAPGSPMGTCNVQDVYVDVAGDTMTGTLSGTMFSGTGVNMSGNISAGGTVSAGGSPPTSTPVTPPPPSPPTPVTPPPTLDLSNVKIQLNCGPNILQRCNRRSCTPAVISCPAGKVRILGGVYSFGRFKHNHDYKCCTYSLVRN